jgi:hypothetical protein
MKRYAAEILREKPEETPWQYERISEAIRRRNIASTEWFVNRDNNEKLEKWRRLNKALRNMVNWSKKETWKQFLGILEDNFKSDEKILYNIMKMKRKENYSTQKFIEKNGAWYSDGNTTEVWEKYFKAPLNGKRLDKTILGKREWNE